MEKILGRVFPNRKSVAPAATMADPVLLEAVFDYAQTDNEDLSSWEIVNDSSSLSSFDVETYSFDSSSSFDDEHVPVLNPTPSQHNLSDHHRHSIESIDGKVASIDDPGQYGDCEDYGHGNYDCDVVEDEEEDCDDDDDYDDELVPRSFSDRFGKQRLMKSGKRACNPKMSNPKKLPCYFYNRPGGVHAAARDGVAWKRKVGRKNEA